MKTTVEKPEHMPIFTLRDMYVTFFAATAFWAIFAAVAVVVMGDYCR